MCHHIAVQWCPEQFSYNPIVFQAVLDTSDSCSLVDTACISSDGK